MAIDPLARALGRKAYVLLRTLQDATGGDVVTSVNGDTGDVTVTAEDLGLGNVDNTTDLNKPISTLTQEAIDALSDDFDTALALKIPTSYLGAASGVCPLDADTLIALSYLPSSVKSGMTYCGSFDPTADTLDTDTASNGDVWRVSADGTYDDLDLVVGDMLIYNSTTGSYDYFGSSNVTVANATTTAVGLVQLAGDLSGTATAPTVLTIGDGAFSVSSTEIAPTTTASAFLGTSTYRFASGNFGDITLSDSTIAMGTAGSEITDTSGVLRMTGATALALRVGSADQVYCTDSYTQIGTSARPAVATALYPSTSKTASTELWGRLEDLEDAAAGTTTTSTTIGDWTTVKGSFTAANTISSKTIWACSAFSNTEPRFSLYWYASNAGIIVKWPTSSSLDNYIDYDSYTGRRQSAVGMGRYAGTTSTFSNTQSLASWSSSTNWNVSGNWLTTAGDYEIGVVEWVLYEDDSSNSGAAGGWVRFEYKLFLNYVGTYIEYTYSYRATVINSSAAT